MMKTAEQRGHKKGFSKGLVKGRKEGREEGVKATALRMKSMGLFVDVIAAVTGLSPEDIEVL